MPKIVVLGAGVGGISMAYELRAKVGVRAEIMVVSDSEWFHFVPSNPWVAWAGASPPTSGSGCPKRSASAGSASMPPRLRDGGRFRDVWCGLRPARP